MHKLNPAQLQAVTYVTGPLLVLAGAGSGKTRVISRKIAHLVANCGLPARNIAALTFTNKAATEMQERVASELNSAQRAGLTVATFHSLGLEIIRREHQALNLKRGFSIFAESDSSLLLENIVSENYAHLPNLEFEKIKHTIDNWKNNLITPAAASAIDPICADIYQDYARLLTTYNAVDFNDLILLPVQLFTQNPAILHKWQAKLRYLLVDEYQDTNLSQFQLIKLLTKFNDQFTVVGDDAQSIYAWRGARPQNITQLQQDYPHLKCIMLEQNYRSSVTILNCANNLIKHNKRAIAKNLWSQLGIGEKVKIVRTNDTHHECEYVATQIFSQHLHHNVSWQDCAVLYRGNHQGKALEQQLIQLNIPYKMHGGTNFFERAEIKDAMSYLRLIINPNDDSAYLRIINVPRREIGQTTLEKLSLWATKRHISLLTASAELGLSSLLDDKTCAKLQQFEAFIAKIRQKCFQNDPISAIYELFQSINLNDWLIQNSYNLEIAHKKIANIKTLIESLAIILERGKNEDLDIVEAINRLVLRDVLERKKEQEFSNEVQLMTLHAAKGLEFLHVYIIGFEEELLPHLNSLEQGLEEERRLAYVGITRAKQYLTLVYALKRKRYGEILRCEISRFGDELPASEVERIDLTKAQAQASKEQGRKHLSAIYQVLEKT